MPLLEGNSRDHVRRDRERAGAPRTAPRLAWHDITRPVAERVDALLAAMTLEEKIGQLGSRWVGNDPADGHGGAQEATGETPRATRPEAEAARPTPQRRPDAGRVRRRRRAAAGRGRPARARPPDPGLRQRAGLTPRRARPSSCASSACVIGGSRLGIPAIVHEECLTGFTTFGATVYPAAIAWGATFDPDLVERMAAAIGADMAALGVHQGLSPVLDVVRDYRWGRVEETMGEDPYLVALLGAAYVRGLQRAGVIATLKHFAGYSASRGARNHGPVPMGRRELLDVVLPPFEAAVRQAGAGSVMNSYADVDGVPAVADAWLLTELLRDAWGFDGTVVSDYWAVPFLASMHRVAADDADAGGAGARRRPRRRAARHARLRPGLVERVRRGDVDEALVDRAARRVLTQKVELGLLDPDWTPEASVAAAGDRRPRPGRATGRSRASWPSARSCCSTPGPPCRCSATAARALRRVAVVGPCADDPRTFMGCYAFPNHVLPRYPGLGLGVEVPTALDALRAELPRRRGRPRAAAATSGRRTAPAFAAGGRGRPGRATSCVALVGDLAGLFGRGTSGRGLRRRGPAAARRPGRPARGAARRPARRSSWSSSPAGPTPWATCTGGPPASSRPSCRARRAARRSPACCPGGCSPAGKLPVQIPRHAGRPAGHLPPAAAGRRDTPAPATSTPARCSRSATAARTPASRSTTCASSADEVRDRRRGRP